VHKHFEHDVAGNPYVAGWNYPYHHRLCQIGRNSHTVDFLRCQFRLRLSGWLLGRDW
jgi:hypothetical protein